jgi:hypothetical protein
MELENNKKSPINKDIKINLSPIKTETKLTINTNQKGRLT